MNNPSAKARNLFFFIKTAFGIVLFYWLISKVEWDLLGQSASDIRISALILASLFFSCSLISESSRLYIVFRQFSISFITAIRMHIVGSVFGALTPGQLGGDVYKIYAVRSRGHNLLQPAFLIMFIRLCGILVMLVCLLLSLLANNGNIYEDLLANYISFSFTSNYSIVVYGVIAALVVGTLLIISRTRVNMINYTLAMYNQIKSCISWHIVIAILVITIIVMLLRVIVLDHLIIAVGYRISIYGVLLIVVFAMIGMLLPISISGLGVREGIIVFLLLAFSVPYESAILVALMSRMLLLVTALGGLVWLYLPDKGKA